MRLSTKVAAVSATFLFFASTIGNALPMPKVTPGGRTVGTMVELREQPTPLGYVLFCMSNVGQCAAGGANRVALNESSWRNMEETNREINARIAPDASKGTSDWSLTTTFGNCNDYAVQKKASLVALGFPASALSLSVVVTPRGEGHLILTVRTDKGDFVLDNLRDQIVVWSSTGYRWVSVQSSVDPNRWVRVRASNSVAPVVSVGARQAPKMASAKPRAPKSAQTFSGAPPFILK